MQEGHVLKYRKACSQMQKGIFSNAEGHILKYRRAYSQIQKGPFFCLNTHALHSCGGKTNLHQDKILLPLTCLPFSPPISLPLLIHPQPIPSSHTFRSQPTPLLSAARSLSVPNPLPVRPQPTLPSPLLLELVHLLPCLFSHTTCYLVPPSPRQLTMLLIELVHL